MSNVGDLWSVRRPKKTDTWQPNRRREKKPKDNPQKGKVEEKKSEGSGPKKAKKILGTVLRVAASMILTVASLYAGYAAYQHAVTSDYFAVKAYNVKGLGRLTEKEVLAAAGLALGDNVFKVDCAAAEKGLVDHPWIFEASVKRKLPRSIELYITERRAAATVLFDVPYLVDDEGAVFKRWSLGDPVPAPVLTGFSREDFVRDTDGILETIRDAISLAGRYRATGLEKSAPLSEVHAELDGSFSLAVGGDPIYVRFGKGPYRKKLRRLADLLGQLKRDGKRPAVIFFDNEVRPDRATVRMKSKARESESVRNAGSGEKPSGESEKRMSKI